MAWDDAGEFESGPNEDPSSADIEALDHSGAYCPHCGEQVWDDAQTCPACGEWFDAPVSRPPGPGQSRQRLFGAILLGVIALIVLFLTLVYGR